MCRDPGVRSAAAWCVGRARAHHTGDAGESATTYGLASQSGDLGAYFTVYATNGEAWQPIGLSTVHSDQRKQVADYVILLGERRGEGLGTEATTLTLDWAFNVVGLRNVTLEVWEPNKAAIRAYEKAGFRIVGVRRQGARWLGQQCDEIIMDAVPEDFTGSVVEHHLHA
ncbi:MAG: GNAT family N-acetyltransferase [Pseudonocardiales bacterium]|nr:GNAT family N-acetyltransferase [Pseudonocardiales bacterium]